MADIRVAAGPLCDNLNILKVTSRVGFFATAITNFAFSPFRKPLYFLLIFFFVVVVVSKYLNLFIYLFFLVVVSTVLQSRAAADEVSDTITTAQRVLDEKVRKIKRFLFNNIQNHFCFDS